MKQELLNDIIQWDIYNWSKAIEYWDKKVSFKKGNKVLALGEREGGLSLWLALKGLDVTCTDYKEFKQTPLDLHKKYNIEGNISYKKADAKNLPFNENNFNIVIFKSMIGALETNESQQKAIAESYRVLKPGGVLIFAENLRATKIHQFARKKFTSWGERWYYPSIKEINTYCNQFDNFQYKTIGFSAPFGRSEEQRKIFSKFDNVTKSITPKTWKYILFGIATK